MQSSQNRTKIIHPKRRPRVTRSWKHLGKRASQTKRDVSITLYPGWIELYDDGAYIQLYDEVVA